MHPEYLEQPANSTNRAHQAYDTHPFLAGLEHLQAVKEQQISSFRINPQSINFNVRVTGNYMGNPNRRRGRRIEQSTHDKSLFSEEKDEAKVSDFSVMTITYATSCRTHLY